MNYTVLLFYKYTQIDDPVALMNAQRDLCEKLGLMGRILIAIEGINGTLEGAKENVEEYINEMNKDVRFSDINWKKSKGSGVAFKKLKVKVRDEIVTTGIKDKDFGPLKKVAGKKLSAQQLFDWYKEGKEFYVVDMRNDYEFEVGHFQNSIWPQGLGHFRDTKNAVKNILHLKDKTVVTVCTGGVRCETASGLLIKYGFSDVYQLENGIVTFMEKFPNTYFDGKLYVFDGRETVGFNTENKEHKVIGKCRLCGKPSENLENYYNEKKIDVYGIICLDCVNSQKVVLAR